LPFLRYELIVSFEMRSILFLLTLVVLMSSCRTAEQNISNPDVVLTGLDGRVFLLPEFSAEAKAKLDTTQCQQT
jgi:hypothetical protein